MLLRVVIKVEKLRSYDAEILHILTNNIRSDDTYHVRDGIKFRIITL